MDDLIQTSREIVDFLETYSWLYNFSNVKVMLLCHRWPSQWSDFIHMVNTNDLKEILAATGEKFHSAPQFVQDFILARNAIVAKFEANYIQETLTGAAKARPCSNEIKKGMNAKKFHEVSRFGSFIIDQCQDPLSVVIDVGSGKKFITDLVYKCIFLILVLFL